MDKKLYRSTRDKMISGVCGGIGDYINIDSTLVRIAVVVLGFTAPFAFIIGYIVCAVVMPEKPYDDEEDDIEILDKDGNKIHQTQKKTRNIIGFGLIGIGCLWLTNKLVWWIDHDIYMGLGIIVLGLIIVLSGMKHKQEADS